MTLGRTASRTVAVPTRMSVSPGSCTRLKARCTSGRRRSASTSSVCAPCWASVIARLAAVVLLPSPGPGLVTQITCSARCSALTNVTLVRSAR